MSEYIVEEPNDHGASCRVHEHIVRCRDCKHCMSYWKSDYCDYFSHVTNDPDGFCAWGERREVDDASVD